MPGASSPSPNAKPISAASATSPKAPVPPGWKRTDGRREEDGLARRHEGTKGEPSASHLVIPAERSDRKVKAGIHLSLRKAGLKKTDSGFRRNDGAIAPSCLRVFV